MGEEIRIHFPHLSYDAEVVAINLSLQREPGSLLQVLLPLEVAITRKAVSNLLGSRVTFFI